MPNAGIVEVAMDLDRSFSDIAKLNGYLLLAVGAVSPLASAFARKLVPHYAQLPEPSHRP